MRLGGMSRRKAGSKRAMEGMSKWRYSRTSIALSLVPASWGCGANCAPQLSEKVLPPDWWRDRLLVRGPAPSTARLPHAVFFVDRQFPGDGETSTGKPGRFHDRPAIR